MPLIVMTDAIFYLTYHKLHNYQLRNANYNYNNKTALHIWNRQIFSLFNTVAE